MTTVPLPSVSKATMKYSNVSSYHSSYHQRKHQHLHYQQHQPRPLVFSRLSTWWNKKRDFIILPEDGVLCGEGEDDSSYDSLEGHDCDNARSPMSSHPLLEKSVKHKQFWDHRSVKSLDLFPNSCEGSGNDGRNTNIRPNNHPLGGTWTTTCPGGTVTKLRVQKHPTPEHLFEEHLGFMMKQKIPNQEQRVAEYLASDENLKNEHGLRLV